MDLLPTHVYGTRLPPRMSNGDLFVKTAVLHDDDKWSGAPKWIRGHGSNVGPEGIFSGWSE